MDIPEPKLQDNCYTMSPIPLAFKWRDGKVKTVQGFCPCSMRGPAAYPALQGTFANTRAHS
eukprot:4538960-Amphidinium_carterae.1